MKKILIATQQLRGGTLVGGETVSHKLEQGGELTHKVQKALGLNDLAVAELVGRGALVEASARIADEGDNETAALQRELELAAERARADFEELVEANKRADDAVTALAEETKRADDAVAALAAETKRADDAVAALAAETKRADDAVAALAAATKPADKKA